MFEPVRGGTRGGQAEFKWSDVSQDKDRENYLGHSINAPTGRWQKNKDVHWYSRDIEQTELERQEEIRKIKEAEEEALSAALGFGPSKSSTTIPGASASGSNAVPVAGADSMKEKTETALEKEERRRLRKAERKTRKEEKRTQKVSKKAEHYHSDDSDKPRPARDRERSRSPHRRRNYEYQPRQRSRSPRRRQGGYEREVGREIDRRRETHERTG